MTQTKLKNFPELEKLCEELERIADELRNLNFKNDTA